MTQPPREERLARGVIIFIAIVVALNLLILGVRAITRSETVDGPPGSTFVTNANGTAALYELYQEIGLDPERLTTGMSSRTLDPTDILFILEPGFIEIADTERLALEDFVQSGGRLVVSGAYASSVLGEMFEDFPVWNFGDTSEKATPAIPGIPADGIGVVSGSTLGGWEDPGRFLPLMVDEFGLPIVVEGGYGDGTVVWVSEVSYLANRNLGNLDNAEFAVALTAGRHPVFNEVIHGAGEGTALLPERWRAAFWLGLLAVVVALIAYGYRMGPPEEEERRLDPERVGYVESVAGITARSGDTRRALEPIRTTARRLLAGRDRRQAGVERIDNERLIEMASRHGLTRDEAQALVSETDETDPLEVAAAFATLQRRLKERL